MKRPPGIWLLLSAGVLWLSLQDVYGIRATELIFGKSTTTSTEASESSSDETATEVSTENLNNVTKPTLTGIPQVDYIWDPNLPKELNGYNLSEYPFYERVPEDIDFKCDGLHDGFYASVPHKCQVYHHCLFGTRYDFLCANYTAFDQKTFICHFVSEVDCVNSKKYWHRNDALYKAATTTTTTIKPLVIYTPPPTPPPVLAGASPPLNPRRPGGGRRRPLRRRRPQYDYYDYDDEYSDYYDERPTRSEARRRKRPRPRPRPIYDDEYEEYEDERYERRGPSRRRNSERRRNKDRRKYEDDDKLEDEEVDNKRNRYHKRRPSDEHEEDDRRRNRPKGSRRPIEDDYEEEEEEHKKPTEASKDQPLIKPSSGSSIYDRPRAPPKINPPVPKNAASKYAYKPVATKAPPTAPAEDEEYYDDYEEEPPSKNQRKTDRHTNKREEERDTRKTAGSRLRASQTTRDDNFEKEAPRRSYKPKYRERPRTSSKKPPVEDYYEEYEEDVEEKPKVSEKSTTTSTSTTTTTTTTSTTTTKPTTTSATTTTTTTPKPTTKDIFKPEAIVRIVKRPFLPSRGGNPYSSRGLQPVGTKATEKPIETTQESDDNIFKPSPVIIKMPIRQKYTQPQVESSEEEFKPVSNRPQLAPRPTLKPSKEYSGPRTTQKPKLPDPDPLDIDENEYDVTLNDALNPTLPNLPVRGYPAGFSPTNEYSFQRPRYVIDESNGNYYQAKPTRQRFEAVAYNPQDHFVNSDVDYKGQYSSVNRPRITQAFFTRF